MPCPRGLLGTGQGAGGQGLEGSAALALGGEHMGHVLGSFLPVEQLRSHGGRKKSNVRSRKRKEGERERIVRRLFTKPGPVLGDGHLTSEPHRVPRWDHLPRGYAIYSPSRSFNHSQRFWFCQALPSKAPGINTRVRGPAVFLGTQSDHTGLYPGQLRPLYHPRQLSEHNLCPLQARTVLIHCQDEREQF